MLSMKCLWCKEAISGITDFAQVEKHLRTHPECTDENIEQAEKSFQQEVRSWESMRNEMLWETI